MPYEYLLHYSVYYSLPNMPLEIGTTTLQFTHTNDVTNINWNM